MAVVSLRLPAGIAAEAGTSALQCEGETVAEALADCAQKEPRLRTRIFREDGSVWVGVFLNGKNVRQTGGLQSPIREGDEIRILPPIAGG